MNDSKPRRAVFEEVAETAAPDAARPDPGAAEARKRRARRDISIWLVVLFALVLATLIAGGATRLTDSGLSITEWRPVTGVIPPMSEADWQAEFEKYKAIPEFQLVNSKMTLAEFKVIYWWEWGHRLLGRVIGVVWLAGFLWFYLRKAIPAGWAPRLFSLGILGGLQGAIGWWMVSSGLVGRMVDVAPYRLAIHLGLAFTILGLIAWFLFHLRRSEVKMLQARRRAVPALRRWGGVLVAVAFVQIVLGAIVAGNDAGRGYIDWPLMGGEFLPSESFNETPLWRNFVENAALVQFDHRMAGYLLAVLALIAFLAARRVPSAAIRSGFALVAAAVLLQVVLGVVTLMNAAPLDLSLAHQIAAVAVFCLILRARFLAAYPPEERIAR